MNNGVSNMQQRVCSSRYRLLWHRFHLLIHTECPESGPEILCPNWVCFLYFTYSFQLFFLQLAMSTSFRLPYGYKNAPSWPSLYWPFSGDFDPLNLIADIPHSLYYLAGKEQRKRIPMT